MRKWLKKCQLAFLPDFLVATFPSRKERLLRNQLCTSNKNTLRLAGILDKGTCYHFLKRCLFCWDKFSVANCLPLVLKINSASSMANILRTGSQLGRFLAQKLKNFDSKVLQNNAVAVRVTVVTGGLAISTCLLGGVFYFRQPSNRDLLEAATHCWSERDALMRERIGAEDKVAKLLFSNAAAAYPLIEKMGNEERQLLKAQVKDLVGELNVGCHDLLRNKDLDLITWKLRNLKMLKRLEMVHEIASEES